jgi:hypothetical protein
MFETIPVDSQFTGELKVGEMVIYNGSPSAPDVIARRNGEVWRIEGNGKSILYLGEVFVSESGEISELEPPNEENLKKPGRWRVLLERVG